MNLFSELTLKFERVDWAKNPELGLIDTILTTYPDLLKCLSADVTAGVKRSHFGRKDTPTVEQVVRAAIYKEYKGMTYRDLEYAQSDSRICETFIGFDKLRPFSFQVWQKYISKIKAESLQQFLVALNKIAVAQGLEAIETIRTDSTVVETNIHYPTNSTLIRDCVKEAHQLLQKLSTTRQIKVRDYRKGVKSNHFKINNTKGDKRVALFKKQLTLFTKSIKQVDRFIKKKDYCSIESIGLVAALADLLPLMEQVYSMTERKEVKGETVANKEKIFSIYERHTDIIVKGGRQVLFGHKINLTDSKSGLILDCEVLRGNPSDAHLMIPALDRLEAHYGTVPASIATDGGYASKANQKQALEKGLVNVIFNKVVGSLQNVAGSKHMQTRLKKWPSGIEATISNLKRRFNLKRCDWKGWGHFQAKVFWSVIAYNIRVMTSLVIAQIV